MFWPNLANVDQPNVTHHRMFSNVIVEEGETETLLANPRGDYTRRLLAAAFTGKVERVKGIEPSS